MGATIAINGVGFSGSVEVQNGETYADALAKAGFNSPDSLDVKVDGETVESPSTATPTDGEQVVATPKRASLG